MQVRVFKFLTGKLYRVFDETLDLYNNLQQKTDLLANMEFGRRLALERDLEKTPSFAHINASMLISVCGCADLVSCEAAAFIWY